jgi:hypothetical protein
MTAFLTLILLGTNYYSSERYLNSSIFQESAFDSTIPCIFDVVKAQNLVLLSGALNVSSLQSRNHLAFIPFYFVELLLTLY